MAVIALPLCPANDLLGLVLTVAAQEVLEPDPGSEEHHGSPVAPSIGPHARLDSRRISSTSNSADLAAIVSCPSLCPTNGTREPEPSGDGRPTNV